MKHTLALLALMTLMSGCSHLPPSIKDLLPQDKPASKESTTGKAEQELNNGLAHYKNANYVAAQRALQNALDTGLSDKQDKLTAYKHLAFIACLNQRQAECRANFRSAFQVDPAFSLTPAEVGHPMWGPVYRSTKEEMSKKKSK